MIHECENCRELERMLAQAIQERNQAREQASAATDLMMKGEALREKMMFESIVGIDEKKARLAYILTGKKP